MQPSETFIYFSRRTDAMIEAIHEIVELESPSFDAARSSVLVGHLESLFRGTDADISIERIPADGFGEHLIVRAFPGNEKPVLLLGHTDTVHPVGTKERNPTRIDDDKFYGCGIFDMKSGIVLMAEALRYFAETGEKPARPITILLTCDEEVGSHSGKALVEQEAEKAHHCLVFEPSSNGRVKTGRKGTGMYTLRAHGIPAHAGLEPEKGANAIFEIARQVERLKTFENLSAGTTVNVCTMKGGTTINVIPEFAECTVDVRFAALTEGQRIYEEIFGLKPFDSRVSLEILGNVNRPPLERTPAVISLFEKAKAVASSFDYELDETQVGGASDGNFVAALGVPVLDGLGVSGAGAHTLEEHILVSDIAPRATLIALLLLSG